MSGEEIANNAFADTLDRASCRGVKGPASVWQRLFQIFRQPETSGHEITATAETKNCGRAASNGVQALLI